MTDHIATRMFGRSVKPQTTRWLRAAIGIVLVCIAAAALWQYARPLSVLFAALAINTVLEYHKVFTSRAPIDIEVVSLTTAYLSASYGFGWGFIMAVAGPVIAHAGINYFGDATVVKIVAAISISIAATLFGASTFGLFGAVLVGMGVQFVIFTFVLGRNPLTNFIARITTIALTGYLLLLLR